MQTLLHFADFHRQTSSGLLQGLLYLEVCKSRSASGIELNISTLRKLLLYFFVLSFALFFLEDRDSFCAPSYRFAQVTITAYHGAGLANSTYATFLRACRLLLRRL